MSVQPSLEIQYNSDKKMCDFESDHKRKLAFCHSHPPIEEVVLHLAQYKLSELAAMLKAAGGSIEFHGILNQSGYSHDSEARKFGSIGIAEDRAIVHLITAHFSAIALNPK